jgi:hypothetical protein
VESRLIAAAWVRDSPGAGKPGGKRTVFAENLLLKQHLILRTGPLGAFACKLLIFHETFKTLAISIRHNQYWVGQLISTAQQLSILIM